MAAAAKIPNSPSANVSTSSSPLVSYISASAGHHLKACTTVGPISHWFKWRPGDFTLRPPSAIMWDQIGGMSGGDSPIAAASSTMALMDCGQALLTANSASGAVEAFRQGNDMPGNAAIQGPAPS